MSEKPSLPHYDEVAKCVRLLEGLVDNTAWFAEMNIEQRVALVEAAGRISRPAKDEIRRRNKAIHRARKEKKRLEDKLVRAATGIREARTVKVFEAPRQITSAEMPRVEREMSSPRNCYVCKVEYTKLHHFYDSMCKECADFNYQKRFQTAPMHGQVALITGSRLKIGYQSTLMMLRSGARVIATTRFPHDSAIRFAKEKDFGTWKDRLHIFGLDLRHTPSVELFCRFVEENFDRLDVLINNAAQTVRRPAGFYSHMMENEMLPYSDLPEGAQVLLRQNEKCKAQLMSVIDPGESQALVSWHGHGPGIGIRASAALSQIPYSFDNSLSIEEVFPKGELDADLQQVDLRETNSWRLRLAEVPILEMLEVQLVNSIAPFVLCSKLAPLMRRDNTGMKHIVNVTAMEGKFHRYTKTNRHPHTNMAKAALNMLTHTSASDLAKDGIFMNAVDTGWVTDEDPAQLSQAKQERHDFQPPLDIVDGAARVCDPFFDGILTGVHWCGKFLKDYKPTDW